MKLFFVVCVCGVCEQHTVAAAYPQKPVGACHGKPSAVNWAWNNKLEVSQIIVYWHFLGIQIMFEILLWLHGKPQNRKDTFESMGYTLSAVSTGCQNRISLFLIRWSMELELQLEQSEQAKR